MINLEVVLKKISRAVAALQGAGGCGVCVFCGLENHRKHDSPLDVCRCGRVEECSGRVDMLHIFSDTSCSFTDVIYVLCCLFQHRH